MKATLLRKNLKSQNLTNGNKSFFEYLKKKTCEVSAGDEFVRLRAIKQKHQNF